MDKHDEHQVRLEKYNQWVAEGNAYPNIIKNRETIAFIRNQGVVEGVINHMVGRIMLQRIMGKAAFMTLEDGSGRLQIYAQKDTLGEKVYGLLTDADLGDVIEVSGRLFYTRTQELTLHVTHYRLLSKSLLPFPDKFHGVTDRELCYRQRYLDLMVNPTTRERFVMRVKMISALRSYLVREGFLEVETPMLQTLAGGAIAKPFVTHHNALDMTLFLRIAPELYLKRLVVGGFERVFEINRNFRNEGLSTRHNPEFTMLEFYQAYAHVEDMIAATEAMLKEVVYALHGKYEIQYQEHAIDFGKPFRIMSVKQALSTYHPDIDVENRDDLLQFIEKSGWNTTHTTLEEMQYEIFEQSVEEKLIDPTFITEYPAIVSPLARQNDERPEIVDRFELFIGGYEIANAFSELNDPLEQAKRFEAQMQSKAQGNDETMPYDADYIQALSYGLPPTAGEGIGIDRLAMILTNAASIKDVIFFPHMRPVEDKA